MNLTDDTSRYKCLLCKQTFQGRTNARKHAENKHGKYLIGTEIYRLFEKVKQ